MTFPDARERPAIALTIAGSDSGGGAGIQADLRSFAAFGVHGLTAITAITAQNTCGVSAIQMVSQRLVEAQIKAVLDDFPVAAIKIGMIGTPGLCRTISRALANHREIPLIVDPVLVATTGASLARGKMVAAIRRNLIPLADLLTPNLPEAEQLLDRRIESRDQLLDAAHELRAAGASAVLLKGGHLPGTEVSDVLVTAHNVQWFSHPRIDVEGHGTGCTLAAAIGAGMATGSSLETAVAGAIDFVNRALQLAYRPGRGSIVVLDHLAAS
ncbi:MAG TPA: bifunctional hydroxymethylpyrimidine kinase/phosphomethylpyrimidine kinase [Dokdonella sp.]|uniref:bifunctional hydroxymethylpyrimidine kinase/phosphomethylpyrimidine kinase n=1 Tax=Dokdonella sp. TaxID=2291710 RepID=UPI002D7F3A5C|nr:bifunctional hydroxymethylpyrimidine kinase/phosphomethylpyrimidine kinase [Dokdonella sp.]HET9033443.1 bifunctional hydroxymethylpyrimidine kinase/phosphomethylpyrimidine kinase [Dokdonella sp.]